MDTPWVVMKFGGTSVASAAGWRTIRACIEARQAAGERPLVVCSAISGVSDLLEELVARAIRGEDTTELEGTLRTRHEQLATDLGVPLPQPVFDMLTQVRTGLYGIRLVREASPKLRARLLGGGELMSTRIGEAWLRANGVDATWADARELLSADESTRRSARKRYLSAVVRPEPDEEVQSELSAAGAVITQGFIASDEEGHTALLGRGGSDTSAAYLGVILEAKRVEIWTDVPGLFTSNPSAHPRARLLERVGYDEAEAFASLGARVLHPRCVGPVREAGIPLHIRSTYLPHVPGTVIGGKPPAGIRAVTSRNSLVRLQMRRPSSWQPVGFLADIAERFRKHGLSIDLVNTAPSLIDATVDPASAPDQRFDELIEDLSQVCEVEMTDDVATVSVVGNRVRSVLEPYATALGQLDGQPILGIVHGAANHHVTFVVDGSVREELAEKLHELLFEELEMVKGPEWAKLQTSSESPALVAT